MYLDSVPSFVMIRGHVFQLKSEEDADGCCWVGEPIAEYKGRRLYQGAIKDNTYFAVGACALMRSSESGSEPYIGRIIRSLARTAERALSRAAR